MMKIIMTKLTSLFCILLISIQGFSQLPKGDRTLAWQVDLAENDNYDSAFSYASVACMESIHLFYTWSSIEDSIGVFNSSYMDATLNALNLYYPATGTKVELQLAPINTSAKEVPKDLMSVAFDDQQMINRFKILLDTLFARIPDVTLSALNIGNEQDIFMGIDSVQYQQYKVFLDSVFPYARQLYFNLHNEDLKLGTTFTHHGLTTLPMATYCWNVNTSCDIVTTTYYPLENDFTMKAPSVVESDFDAIVDFYSDTTQPIYFAECGYASSPFCNSSDFQQAQFYTNVFSAWDKHYANIKYLTIFKSTDWSQAVVDELGVYYGFPNDTTFKEYLRTLGVRTFNGDGSNKLAYETILCELNDRSWCPVNCTLTGIGEEFNEPSLQIYPNPTTGVVFINTTQKISSLSLYDMHGKKDVLSVNNEIDLNHYSKGMYMIHVELESGKSFMKKLMIE